MAKRYGLILPGMKSEPIKPKADFTRPSIFGSESDSDDTAAPVKIACPRVAMGPGNAEKRQARRLQQKALEEDPTVFQYDELYDEMEHKRDEEKMSKSKEVKKPRYINRLLECAERRKIEYERRIERMAQKEREAEGDQFKDKECFVTSAYRKKLEELKKAEEREKREDYLEAIGDVTRQQDLGGFYRHLYEQKLGPKDSVTVEEGKEKDLEKTDKVKAAKSRAYRKRHASDDEEEEANSPLKNETAAKKAHLQSNLDADSDFSIDSSSDSEEEKPEDKKSSPANEVNETEEIAVKQEPGETPVPNANGSEVVSGDGTAGQEEQLKAPADTEENKEEAMEKVPKKDIWKKRTVGEVFDAALQRYYERKSTRTR